MRCRPFIALLMGGLLSSCAFQTGSTSTSQIPSTSECFNGLISKNSKLADELVAADASFKCYHFSDNGKSGITVEITAATTKRYSTLYPGEDIGDLFISTRKFDTPGELSPSFDFGRANQGAHSDYFPLDASVPIHLGSTMVDGQIFGSHSWPGNISYACMYATTQGSGGTPFQVMICRSTAVGVSDSLLVEWAKKQIAADFSSINPI